MFLIMCINNLYF